MLQGFEPFDSDGQLVRLAGLNKDRWKMAIGNAMPPPAARAIAEVCAETLKRSRAGGFWLLSPDKGVWVEPHKEATLHG